jgi:hypothetical protein
VPETIRRESNWQLASVSWARQRIDFNDMLDAAGFAERFDAELHYSLGDLWTRAFVETCGLSALGDFVRATGRDGAVLDLPAGIFWRDTMQEISCDLDTVNEQWANQMEQLNEQVPASRFPLYSDVVVKRDEESSRIIIDATLKSAEEPEQVFDMPTRFIVRIGRSSTQLASGVDAVFRGTLVSDSDQPSVRFQIPISAMSGSRFRYQLGFSPSEESRYYYEMWRRGSF